MCALAKCRAEPGIIPLVDFADPAVATGCVFVAGKGDAGTGKLAAGNGCATFEFSGLNRASLLVPAFSNRVSSLPPENHRREFYLKYRARSFDGNILLVFPEHDAAKEIPVKTTGKPEIARVRPELVSCRGRQLCNRQVSRIKFSVNGAGSLDLLEFGAMDYGPLPPPHDAGLPHVDSEAFAFFPEPRIFRDTGKTLPLADFGTTFRLSGDVPPGAVAYFTKEMKDFYGLSFAQSRLRQGFGAASQSAARIEFAVSAQCDIPGYCDIKFDGFAIEVAAGRIRVAAKDPKGLTFGIHMLCDMVKMATGDVDEPKVRLCTVVDWPRMDKRILLELFPHWRHDTRYDPDSYFSLYERFAVAARYNMFCIDPRNRYLWESTPEVPPWTTSAWTRVEFERVVDRFNANSFTVLPKLNGLGHMSAYPLVNKELGARYGEDGDMATLCTGNPDSLRLLFAAFDELLAICSRNPKYAPKHFHVGLDECRWRKTAATPVEKRCPRCAGIPKNRIFLDQTRRLDDWCHSNGVRMAMWADMIRPYHNGLDRWKCYEIEHEIPKDVIYVNWAFSDGYEIRETTEAGHENWKILTGYSDDPEGDGFITAHGLGIYTPNWWLVARPAKPGMADNAEYGLMAQRILSDATWRRAPSSFSGRPTAVAARNGDGFSLVRRWGDFILRNWSRQPIPHGAATFAPVDFGRLADLPLSAAFDTGLKSLSGVPVRLNVRDGKVCALEAKKTPAKLAVGRKAASLVFLHAVTGPEEFYMHKNRKNSTTGDVVAGYSVEYDDGTRETVDIRHGWHTAEYLSRPVLVSVFSRYPAGCRAIWTAPLPPPPKTATCRPDAPDTAVTTMYEWVNPHPDKTIVSLSLAGKDKYGRYAVLAISARDIIPPTPFGCGAASGK